MSAGDAALPNSIAAPTHASACDLAEGDRQFSKNVKLTGTRTQGNLGWRWIKFNLVGCIGVLVQLSALWVLTHIFRCHYLVATALAVETAVLHNFLWHQRFTWADRLELRGRQTLARVLQFNLANGLVSVAGNLLLMETLVGRLHLRILLANGLSIVACSGVNFCLSEMYVFRSRAISPRRREDTEKARA